jgi:hypothetical protein
VNISRSMARASGREKIEFEIENLFGINHVESTTMEQLLVVWV